MRAWTFQDHRRKKKSGEKRCPWSVGWIDPDGKRRSKKIGSRSMAGKFARRLEGELASGTYRAENRTLWGEFRKEYEGRMGPLRVSPRTWRTVRDVLNHFERLVHPGRVESIKTTVIDQYVATRQTETGHKKARISPATINRELRHLKAVLRIAHEWG